jgi:hypothetical protein
LVWTCTKNGRNRIPKRVLYMNSVTTRLRGRPRNRWQDEVREDGRIVGGEGWQEKYMIGMEEAPENGKESSNSAQANGMNESTNQCVVAKEHLECSQLCEEALKVSKGVNEN